MQAFVNGLVVVIVANIPQGLPATVTSALVLTVQRMKGVQARMTPFARSLNAHQGALRMRFGTVPFVNVRRAEHAHVVTHLSMPVHTCDVPAK